MPLAPHFRTIKFVTTGFTTLEVLFALILVSIALLALEGTTTRTVQRIADSHRESLAADLARKQVDRLIALRCTSGAGADSINNVVVQWTARITAASSVATVEQHIQYPIAFGMHRESLTTAISCH